MKVEEAMVDSLWDTGADRSLIRKSVANKILKATDHFDPTRKARLKPLGYTLRVHGIGEDILQCTHQILAHIKFPGSNDTRTIAAAVVHDNIPYELIIGQDFMRREAIGFEPTPNGFYLTDCKKSNRPLLYNSDSPHEAPKQSTKNSRNLNVNSKPLKRKKKTRFAALAAEWNAIPEEDRKLIYCLSTCRLAKISPSELADKLGSLTGDDKTDCDLGTDESAECLVTEQTDIPEHLKVPICDFPEHQGKLQDLVLTYKDVFSSSTSDVGRAKGPTASIKLAQDKVVNLKNYRTPHKLKPVLKQLVQDLLDAGIIEPSESHQFNSPCLLVPKKAEGSIKKGVLYRLVVDYRALNKIIESAVFPIPRIQDIFQQYKGCTAFSSLDIRHAFYTIGIDKQSRHLTAFGCEFGKFQFKFLPQGLKISPAVFQNQIEQDLKGLDRINPYIDDIMSGDPGPDDHLRSLGALFQRLRTKGYKLKLNKCLLMKKQVTHLGAGVGGDGISIPPDKKEAVREMKPPTTQSEIKSLLGFTSFLREHVPCYADVTAPIQNLLGEKFKSKNESIKPFWKEEQQVAFEAIKEMLLTSPGLAFADPSKPFVLWTDASKRAMSAVLMQKVNDNIPPEQVNTIDNCRPIGYWSKAFKGSQRNWAALVKEARAVYDAVLHYANLIAGCKVYLRCDHKPLVNFLHARTKNEMVNRWSIAIQQFDISFDWVATDHNIADCLSRLCPTRLFQRLDIDPEDDIPPFPKAQGEQQEQGIQVGAAQALEPHDPNLIIQDFAQISTTEMIALQARDSYCKRIIARKASFQPEHNGKFHLIEGLLYKQFTPSHNGHERLPSLALVVPQVLVLTVLVNLHRELQHAGRDRMIAAIVPRLYWKRIHKTVANFVRGCQVCQYRHLKDAKFPFVRVSPPSGPGFRMALDLWSGGGGVLLTALDTHSQYPFAEPIPNKTSAAVTNAFLNILSYFRTPNEIVTDNGAEFRGPEFQDLVRKLNIKQTFLAPRSPQGNPVERFHRFLGEQFRLTSNLTDQHDWWACVRAAVSAYRKTPHSSAGETPLFLQTGQDPTYNIDHLLPVKSRLLSADQDSNAFKYLKIANGLARKNICLSRKRSSVSSQGTVEDKPLSVGDRVFRKNVSGQRHKTDPHWLPGYRIVGFQSGRTAIIEHTASKTKARVNVRHLRWADPISELINNTQLDVVPGQSKLYLSAQDMADLNWQEIPGLPPLDPAAKDKIDQIVRDRSYDLRPQKEPVQPKNNDVSSRQSEQVEQSKRAQRARRHPARLNDFYCGCSVSSRPRQKSAIVSFDAANNVLVVSECMIADLVDQPSGTTAKDEGRVPPPN